MTGLIKTTFQDGLLKFGFECDSVTHGDVCAMLEVTVSSSFIGPKINTIKDIDDGGREVLYSELTPFDKGRLESRIDQLMAKYTLTGEL